ncbi:hypothetical protein QFZ34_003219 [Phyllobacterium ifriqiyense]|uniref:Uncharacterized protein n=1 Tax=Phyllobacterium ifriqiyense TaxID=314238 RepID=A0ABU0SBA1_9HYPH|nr:hypothetical protein [Phyllobacterium ifriqiyense]MDQ0998037.1 hypothetical protein [Phyllobacterium ifriqiyense]
MSTLLKSGRKTDDITAGILPDRDAQSIPSSDGQRVSGNWSSTALELPKLSGAAAGTAKIAGRIAATRISAIEHDRLLMERQRLLDKKLDRTITKAEENRLAYVRWSLDRIEDAKFGMSLDVLESQVNVFENLNVELNKFYDQLNSKIPRKNR